MALLAVISFLFVRLSAERAGFAADQLRYTCGSRGGLAHQAGHLPPRFCQPDQLEDPAAVWVLTYMLPPSLVPIAKTRVRPLAEPTPAVCGCAVPAADVQQRTPPSTASAASSQARECS